MTSNLFSVIATKLAGKCDRGGGSRGCVQVTAALSCRMREIAGVGTVDLVYVGGLLKMGGDSFLVPVWISVGDGLTGTGESDVWIVKAGT